MHIKTIQKLGGRTFVAGAILSLLLGLAMSLLSAPRVEAKEQGNALLFIGEKCAGLNDIDHDFGKQFQIDVPAPVPSTTKTESNCLGWEASMQDSLGCKDLFYEREFEDGTKKWYTKEAAYKECWKSAAAQYKLIAEKCKKVKDDTDLWNNKCEKNQNNLHKSLGCDNKLFFREGDYWKPKPKALASCKKKIDQVGAVNITVFGADGQPKKNDNPISSETVASTGGGSGSGADDPQADCDAKLSSTLSWILCPIIDIGVNMSDYVFENFILPFLENVPISTDPQDGSYKAWSQFRILANVLLIGTMLMVVYAQTKGGGR